MQLPSLFLPVALVLWTLLESAVVQAEPNHLVRSRFEPGPGDAELTFVFDVRPAPAVLPTVRLLGATPHDKSRALTVKRTASARFIAVLGIVPSLADGKLVVELSTSGTGPQELHGADFALRDQSGERPSPSPSRNGRFVVSSSPEGVSGGARLLIGSTEQPIEDLPPDVAANAVEDAYSVDFLPASPALKAWQLTLAVTKASGKPLLYFHPKGRGKWQLLESQAIHQESLLGASLPGPGTCMVVRKGVTR
jgi:hypothetical protein